MGGQWYTMGYRKLFKGRPYVVMEISKPCARRYGGPGAIAASCAESEQYFQSESLIWFCSPVSLVTVSIRSLSWIKRCWVSTVVCVQAARCYSVGMTCLRTRLLIPSQARSSRSLSASSAQCSIRIASPPRTVGARLGSFCANPRRSCRSRLARRQRDPEL